MHGTSRLREVAQVVAGRRVCRGATALTTSLGCAGVQVAGRRVAETGWRPIVTRAVQQRPYVRFTSPRNVYH